MEEELLIRNPSYCSYFTKNTRVFLNASSAEPITFTKLNHELLEQILRHLEIPKTREKLISELVDLNYSKTKVNGYVQELLNSNVLSKKTSLPKSPIQKPTNLRLLLCITGAIEAVNIFSYIQMLKLNFTKEVKFVLTKSARKLVSKKALSFYFKNEIHDDVWELNTINPAVQHIELTRWSQIILVLPATASMIHKIAQASCSDLISLIASAKPPETPLVIAPSMNHNMWNNFAVRDNIEKLKKNGLYIIEPGLGFEVNEGLSTQELKFGPLGVNPLTLIHLLSNIYYSNIKRLSGKYVL